MMPVDSFKYIPRLVARYYKLTTVADLGPIPWTPLSKPLTECTFALVTSAGLYNKRHDPPFDLAREEREPTWGDPSYRSIRSDIPPGDIGASHSHLNTSGVLTDRNVLLPIDRFQELTVEGRVGCLAKHHYSFMGYQGFPSDLSGWTQKYGPEVTGRLRDEQVDCIFLTTA
jgi:D-proline reductase (dithiol) PrdB